MQFVCRTVRRCALVCLSLFSLFLSAPPCQADDADIAAALGAMLRQEWQAYGSAQAAWSGGIGVQVVTPQGSHYASAGLEHGLNDIHFRGASLTKTFTAAAVLLLQQRGLLDIDHRIVAPMPGRSEPYAPDTPDFAIPYKELITIRQLLGHVAGVFDVDNDATPPDIEAPYAGQRYVAWKQAQNPAHTFSFAELAGVAAAHGLAYFAPEVGYHYSNTGYSILGAIIERVSGMSYATFLQEALLAPNGLDDTSFPDQGDESSLPQPAPASSYSLENRMLTAEEAFNPSAHVAEGNLVTTPADLARWIYRLFRAEAGVGRELITQMTDVEQYSSDYGLGCNFNSDIGYGHVGALHGWMTVAGYLPAADTAVVVFANMTNVDDLEGQIQAMYTIARKAREIVASYSPDAPAWSLRSPRIAAEDLLASSIPWKETSVFSAN